MIEFACPHCRHSIKIQSQFAGRQGKCARCGRLLVVPQLASPSAVEQRAQDQRHSTESMPPPTPTDDNVQDWLGAPPKVSINAPASNAATQSPTTTDSYTIPDPPEISPTLASPIQGTDLARVAAAADRRVEVAGGRKRDDAVRLFDWDAGILGGLFDWKFRKFITPAIVSSLYSWNLLLAGIFLAAVFSSNLWLFINSPARDSVYFYVSLVALDLSATVFVLIWTLAIRLLLEAVMVIFRGEEHLHLIADRRTMSGD